MFSAAWYQYDYFLGLLICDNVDITFYFAFPVIGEGETEYEEESIEIFVTEEETLVE